MAIERFLLDRDTQQKNVESILDFIGSDLPDGVTITIDSGRIYVKASSARMSWAAVISETGNNQVYTYGYRTSKGVMITTRGSDYYFAVTKSNLGTDAVIGRQAGATGIHALDLTYSNIDSLISISQVQRDITSFTPIVLSQGTYTPYCYICHEAQNNSLVACTMMAGGKTFAYSGLVALED